MSNDCQQCEIPKRQFNLRQVAVWTTIAAATLALFPLFQLGSRIILSLTVLTFVFGCWRTRKALLATLAGLYLPMFWVVLDSSLWTNPQATARLYWAQMYFQTPSIPFSLLLRSQFSILSNDQSIAFQIVTALMTYGYILIATSLGRINRTWLIATSLATFILGIVLSLINYQIYLA